MKNLEIPIIDALIKYKKKKIISYDVPGHKRYFPNTEFSKLLGNNIHSYDLNAPIGLDNVIKPDGVIKDSLNITAKVYHSDKALYLINGSSSGIHIMIMAACKEYEKIIVPRNAHKSIINAIIFSGVIPIFIDPPINKEFGIAKCVSSNVFINAIKKNSDAKAIFLIYPTYYGEYIDIRPIIRFAHRMHMVVLVDQAHGSHFSFHPKLPISSSLLDADLIVLSTHKTTGSLTQSSLLLYNNNNFISFNYLKEIYLMFCTSSPSYLLMASLESSRKYMFDNGKKIYEKLIKKCKLLKKQLNTLPNISTLNSSFINKYDPTKIVINVSKLGYSGFEVYEIMFKRYNIQLELGEPFIVLAIIGVGDIKKNVLSLFFAFKDLINEKKLANKNCLKKFNFGIFGKNLMILSPREAFFLKKNQVSIKKSLGLISGETITLYPPGIPICIIGELITKEIIRKLLYYKSINPYIKIQKYSDNNNNILVIN